MLRKFSKLVQEARANQQDELVKKYVTDYDEAMERLVLVIFFKLHRLG